MSTGDTRHLDVIHFKQTPPTPLWLTSGSLAHAAKPAMDLRSTDAARTVLAMSLAWRPDAPPNLVKLAVGRCLISVMDQSRWLELGLLTGASAELEGHPRLLRSLRFGDDDYERCVFDVVSTVLGQPSLPRPLPEADPWGPSADQKPSGELPLHEQFPNLEMVCDFLGLPAWLALNDEKLLGRLFATDGEATLPDGTVLSAAEAAAARLQVGEMRRQIERIRRDHAEDPEAAVGQAKELIETTCKTILGLTGDAPDTKEDLPKLVTQALRHLGLDASQVQATGGDAVEARAAKRLLGGVASILNGAGELRNSRGTGHGRSGSPMVDPALARLAVGVVLPAVLYLVEAYEARTQDGAAPTLVDYTTPAAPLAPGAIVSHETFGEGQVVTVQGAGANLVASVDFGLEVGTRQILVKHSPLTVIRT